MYPNHSRIQFGEGALFRRLCFGYGCPYPFLRLFRTGFPWKQPWRRWLARALPILFGDRRQMASYNSIVILILLLTLAPTLTTTVLTTPIQYKHTWILQSAEHTHNINITVTSSTQEHHGQHWLAVTLSMLLPVPYPKHFIFYIGLWKVPINLID